MKRRNFFGSLLGASAIGVVASKVEAEPEKILIQKVDVLPRNPLEGSIVCSDNGFHVFKQDQWWVLDYSQQANFDV